MRGKQNALLQKGLALRAATEITAYSSKSIHVLFSEMGKIKLTSQNCCEDENTHKARDTMPRTYQVFDTSPFKHRVSTQNESDPFQFHVALDQPIA